MPLLLVCVGRPVPVRWLLPLLVPLLAGGWLVEGASVLIEPPPAASSTPARRAAPLPCNTVTLPEVESGFPSPVPVLPGEQEEEGEDDPVMGGITVPVGPPRIPVMVLLPGENDPTEPPPASVLPWGTTAFIAVGSVECGDVVAGFPFPPEANKVEEEATDDGRGVMVRLLDGAAAAVSWEGAPSTSSSTSCSSSSR